MRKKQIYILHQLDLSSEIAYIGKKRKKEHFKNNAFSFMLDLNYKQTF